MRGLLMDSLCMCECSKSLTKPKEVKGFAARGQHKKVKRLQKKQVSLLLLLYLVPGGVPLLGAQLLRT